MENQQGIYSLIIQPVLHVLFKTHQCYGLVYIPVSRDIFFHIFFTGFVFIMFFSPLFRHFNVVDQPTLNLNFCTYSTYYR